MEISVKQFHHNFVNKFFGILLLLIILNNHPCAKCEFYSSVQELSKLFKYETYFLTNMEKFIKENENKLVFLKTRLIEMETEHDEALSIGLEYFENPVNKYLLTKRLLVDWERVQNLIEHKSGKKHLDKIKKSMQKEMFPDESELRGAIEGFLRLQDIYRLKTNDMASGVLQGRVYPTYLDASLCFDIGQQASNINKPKLAHSWFLKALDKNGDPNKTNLTLQIKILDSLAQSKIVLRDFRGANQIYMKLLLLTPDNKAFVKKYASFLEKYRKQIILEVDLMDEHEPLPVNMYNLSEDDAYKLTCSGYLKRSASEERYLRCGYLTETHPFLNLAPIKVEELNHDPLLVLYYDIISDNEIAVMKELVHNRIQRATIIGHNGSVISPVRTSQFVFLPKSQHRLLETIDRRVEDMTNLNMLYSEDHQFANYGVGGHYAQHYDWFYNADKSLIASPEMGNRIGTVLFYLSDVEQGGGTAFPHLKTLLMPKKGTAAFWYNLHASGDGDMRTLHGACPIIVGSKWVQNRWIREFYQDERRPCLMYNDKT